MKQVEIWFDELTEEAQTRVLKANRISNPKEANWDVFAVGIIYFEESK